jgi:hypothetical protein
MAGKDDGLDALALIMQGGKLPATGGAFNEEEEGDEQRLAQDMAAVIKVVSKRTGGDPISGLVLLHACMGEVMNMVFEETDEEDGG